MRALITGAAGFAGAWLCRACATADDEVIGLSRRGTVPEGCGEGWAVDLTDPGATADAVHRAAPDVVYHLAALSSVGLSWQRPRDTLADNVGGAVNLLEAIRTHAPDARTVWVSSCEVYGNPGQLPTAEEAVLAPANPYAVSKTASEQLARVYEQSLGLSLVIARPFSHSGPGQRPIYLLSNLARQGARARRDGDATAQIVTGNPDTRRDFCDVRDVVAAYRELARSDVRGVFNVSSGTSISAAEQVTVLGELLAPVKVRHVVDPGLVRASEVMELRGDHARLTEATGWEPRIGFTQTMSDTLEWWQSRPGELD